MFDGKIEIRKALENTVVMTRIEDERLLQLQGTFARAQNFAYIYQYDEGTFTFGILLHGIFGNLNYDSIYLMKINGVSSLPTIPRKLKQCGACILRIHRKKPFHGSTSRAH